MVALSYMVQRRARAGEFKRIFDQQVVPAAINAAGRVESGIEHVAASLRRNPLSMCLVAFMLGGLVARAMRLRR